MIDGRLTLWTIMDRPTDFPDKIVIVLDWVGNRPARDPGRWFADSVEHAREIIHTNDPTADQCLLRDPSDPLCIVETWL